jgi:hypothetical protein
MESGGGGGRVEGDRGALFVGRPRIIRIVLFGPCFNMGAIDLGSGEERESDEEEWDSEEERESVEVEESSPEEQVLPPPSPSSQFARSVAGKSHTKDPFSHYQSPCW